MISLFRGNSANCYAPFELIFCRWVELIEYVKVLRNVCALGSVLPRYDVSMVVTEHIAVAPFKEMEKTLISNFDLKLCAQIHINETRLSYFSRTARLRQTKP